MSPLPRHLFDRWQHRPDPADPARGVVYWHVLLGDEPQVRELAAAAQQRLAGFTGLHLTPLRWLHITTLVAGSTAEISDGDLKDMLAKAALALSSQPPVTVELGRILYHSEAIMFAVRPAGSLSPLHAAAVQATPVVRGRPSDASGAPAAWIPHMTLCYSTREQPAAPVIAALGKELPRCKVQIEALSLVVQHGPERDWDWRVVGAAHLQG